MKMIQAESKKFLSIVAVFFVVLFVMFAKGCGGGGSSTVVDGDDGVPPTVVAAPGVPTNFTVVATPNALLSATLTWSAPTTGDAPTSYEIYRSTTADNIFDPANLLISLPATTYEFIDDAGLDYGVTTYWIVVATNDGGETPTLPADYTFVEAPGVPTNFVVAVSAVGGDLSATLKWAAPKTGGEVASYELYRYSSEVPTVNHLISLPADTFEFIDNAGLERGVTTYWILTAKNAGGETPTFPVEYTPPGAGQGEVDKYGNNFAAAMIFADGYGIGIDGNTFAIDGNWTEDNISLVDYKTGLRPTELEIPTLEALDKFPYFDENTTFEKDGVTYYKQKTISTWQGEWIDGSNSLAEHNVTAKWGDNLISQTLNTESIVRIEMVLTKALDTNMTAYNMVPLYGEKDVEIYGTDGNTTTVDTAFVFATNARLTIQQVDGLGGNPTIRDADENQTLFDTSVSDGPGKFAAEINVAGNLVYGYVWDLKQNPVPAGTYRITFSLDDSSASTSTPNNVIIGEVAVPEEGENPYTTPVRDSPTQVHIDIIIH